MKIIPGLVGVTVIVLLLLVLVIWIIVGNGPSSMRIRCISRIVYYLRRARIKEDESYSLYMNIHVNIN